MEITSWRGYDFSTAKYWIGIRNADAIGNWENVLTTQGRQSANSLIVGMSRSPRPIVCQWGYSDDDKVNQAAWHEFMRDVKPLKARSGTLTMQLAGDNTEWSCEAYLQSAGKVVEDGVNVYQIVWLTSDPLWHGDIVETQAGAVAPVTTITNPTFATNTTGWTMGSLPASVTAAFSRDAAVYSDAAGSGKVAVTVNSGAGGIWYVENDQKFACSEGASISFKCATRSSVGYLSSAGIYATPVMRWYTAGDAFISQTEVDGVFIPGDIMAANTWSSWWTLTGHPAYNAPANTAYGKIGIKIGASAGATGTVYFDAFEFMAAPYASTPIDVEGHAPTYLTLTATPTGNFPQSIYARTFSITNNGDTMVENLPYLVSLGNNSASPTTGAYYALLREGKVIPCSISDYDNAMAFMWMVIDRLAPGQTADYVLLVSNQTVLPNTTFTALQEPTFDNAIFYGTASGGSHSTTETNTTGLGSENNRWDEGLIIGITGVNAGVNRRISASTSTKITHAAFPSAFSNTDKFVILMSHNGATGLTTADWVYSVRQTSRASDAKRGLWPLDVWASKKPGTASYQSPGAWHPYRYWNNADIVGQSPFFKIGTDYYAGLDADRRWENGGDLDYQGYDGVSITMPCNITQLKYRFEYKNPNGMCTAILGTRQAGGSGEFVHEYEIATASTTLTAIAEQTTTLTPNTRQAYLGQVPTNGTEIGTAWAGASGTASGSGATTLTDSSAEWITNQFAGGKVSITTGTAQAVTISSNTATALTVASWPSGTPTTTAGYTIRNKPYVSTLRLIDQFRMTWDPTNIAISAVSAETPAYILYRDILIDYNDDGDPWQRVAINPETTGRYIVLYAGESLVVDGETMQARIVDSLGDTVRTVQPQALTVYDIDEDGTQRAANDWLWFDPGEHTISLANDEAGVACTVDAEWIETVHA